MLVCHSSCVVIPFALVLLIPSHRCLGVATHLALVLPIVFLHVPSFSRSCYISSMYLLAQLLLLFFLRCCCCCFPCWYGISPPFLPYVSQSSKHQTSNTKSEFFHFFHIFVPFKKLKKIKNKIK
jgi:hypothetical protein